MYSESDTRVKLIDPKLHEQGWKESQIKREYSFTDGRILPGGKRGVSKYVDYLLKDFGLNLAIIEAKREELPVTEGLEQVKGYGASLSFGEEMKTKLERAEYVRGQGMVQSIENLTAKKFIEYLLGYYGKHGNEEIVQSKLGDLIKLYSKDELSIVDFTKRVGGQNILMNMWKDVQGELFKI